MKTVVVSGATKGIGAAITTALSTTYEVIGIARNRPANWSGSFIEADLGTKEGIDAASHAVRSIENVWGLVNNAGIGAADPISEIDLDVLQRVFLINTFAPALLTRSAVGRMNGGGRIVNICSSAMLGKPERTAYGSSKAALASMTRTWALELAGQQIAVNAVSPGPIETELFRSRNPVGSAGERSALDASPMHALGQPTEIAQIVALLMEPSLTYMTGQIIGVDGGLSAGPASLL